METMETQVYDGKLGIYRVTGLFPARLHADFFEYGAFHRQWLHDPLHRQINLDEYLVAINDRWTPNQQHVFGGIDILVLYEESPNQWQIQHACRKNRFSSPEERKARLEEWIPSTVRYILDKQPFGLTILYQGKDFSHIENLVLTAFAQKYVVRLVEPVLLTALASS